MRIISLFLYLLFGCIVANAQVTVQAEKYYKQAMTYKAKRQDAKAVAKMRDAITCNPGYREAYSTLGEWYFMDRNYKEAIALLRLASASTRNGGKTFAKPLFKCLLHDYQFTEAQQVLTQYATYTDSTWEYYRDLLAFMQKTMKDRLKDTVTNLGIRINGPYADMYPNISSDTNTLYFTRRMNGVDEDFYQALPDTCGGWFYALNMGSPPNTLAQEAAQSISADGHYQFFMRCENRSDNGWDQGGCDLFMAYRADSVWSVPQPFGATINTPAFEGFPCLSSDNRELYFVSNRDGGFGGLDIWVSRFENGLWQAPRNLGPDINTSTDETMPFLHTDNNTLYFASDGHMTMGGSDIYYCRRKDDTTWEKPANIGYPINTSANENSICISLDGTKAYFSSDRDSVAGNFDIYSIPLPVHLQPLPVALLNGHAYDSLSKERLNYTSIYIRNANTGEQLYHYTSNRGDGSYMITLPVGSNYVYDADRLGYLNMTDTIKLTGLDATSKVDYNIPLLPSGYQVPVTDSSVLTLYFPKNSTELSDSDRTVIFRALEPWVMDKTIQVMVNGHTDNSGTPLINEELSYIRATLVAKEIASYGIDEMNIKAYGYGETHPLVDNDTDEQRDMNRRVEVIIRR